MYRCYTCDAPAQQQHAVSCVMQSMTDRLAGGSNCEFPFCGCDEQRCDRNAVRLNIASGEDVEVLQQGDSLFSMSTSTSS